MDSRFRRNGRVQRPAWDSFATPFFTLKQPEDSYLNSNISLSSMGDISDKLPIRLYEFGNTRADDAGAATNRGTFRVFDHTGSGNIQFTGHMDSAEVPIPSAIWLLGSGLIGFIGLQKKSRESMKQ